MISSPTSKNEQMLNNEYKELYQRADARSRKEAAASKAEHGYYSHKILDIYRDR
jgi:hypothetical protein